MAWEKSPCQRRACEVVLKPNSPSNLWSTLPVPNTRQMWAVAVWVILGDPVDFCQCLAFPFLGLAFHISASSCDFIRKGPEKLFSATVQTFPYTHICVQFCLLYRFFWKLFPLMECILYVVSFNMCIFAHITWCCKIQNSANFEPWPCALVCILIQKVRISYVCMENQTSIHLCA